MADTPVAAPNADDNNENPYVKAVNKRLRLVKKKLQKIDAMEGKDAATLDEGQKALLQNQPTLKILFDELTQILSAFETVDGADAPAPEPQDDKKEKKSKKGDKGDKGGKGEKQSANDKQPDPPQDNKTSEPEQAEPVQETEVNGEPEQNKVEEEAAPVESTPPPAAGPEVQATVDTPPVEESPAPVEAPPPSSALDREKLETVTQLFKALSVLSNPYLYLRLAWNLRGVAQNTQNSHIEVEEQLKELRYLACFCLEFPITDPSYQSYQFVGTRPQDTTGMEHLSKFLEMSTDKPNIFSVEAQPPVFVPMSQTYADLAVVLKRVSQAMQNDPYMQAQTLELPPSAGNQPNQMRPPAPQDAMGASGYPQSAPSNPFTVPGTEGMVQAAYGGAMGMEGAPGEVLGGVMQHPSMEQQAQVAQHVAEASAAYGGGPYAVQPPMANDMVEQGGMNEQADGPDGRLNRNNGHRGGRPRNMGGGGGMNGGFTGGMNGAGDNGGGRQARGDGQSRAARRRTGSSNKPGEGGNGGGEGGGRRDRGGGKVKGEGGRGGGGGGGREVTAAE